MGTSSGVGSSLSSSRQASGPDLIGDLLGSDSSGTSEFPSAANNNPPPASNASLFELSKRNSSSSQRVVTLLPKIIDRRKTEGLNTRVSQQIKSRRTHPR